MQLIFVVEASAKSQSDFYYISETIIKYYNYLGHKITPVFMDGKGRFDKKESEINKNIAKYQKESKVFICYDIDNRSNPAYLLNAQIDLYSNNKGYEIIWFNENVEQVYVRKSIPNSEKTKRAKQFVAYKEIEKIKEDDLFQTTISKKKSSNILTVLDKYLKRK